MANYPIKMLKDENNTPFVPLVGTDAIVDPEGKTLEERLLTKLGPDNLKAGDYVNVRTEGYDCYIDVDLPSGLTLIDNLETETSGQGSLDAHQGKVLKDSIPDIVNNLTTIDTNKGLSAYQGYLLNNKFNNYTTTTDMNTKFGDYTTTTDMNTKFNNYLLKTGGTLSGDLTVEQGSTDEPYVRVSNGSYALDLVVGDSITNRGLYDRTKSSWMLVKDANDDVTLYGHSTLDLRLTGGTMTGGIINTGVVFAHQGYTGDKNSVNQLHWYSVGYSPASSASSPWWNNYALCLNNYWGIDIRTQDDNSLRHNGGIVLHTHNYGVTLWTNSSPTSGFSTLSATATGMANYSYIEIYFYNWGQDNVAGRLIKCVKIPVSNGAKGNLDAAINLVGSDGSTSTCHFGQRSATLNTSNNTVSFSVMHGAVVYVNGTTPTGVTSNDWIIPIKIVGYR